MKKEISYYQPSKVPSVVQREGSNVTAFAVWKSLRRKLLNPTVKTLSLLWNKQEVSNGTC